MLNRANIVLCLELLKAGDPSFPVIVDAGVGSASDVSIAMELGADGVLLNTAVAHAEGPGADGTRDASRRVAGRQSSVAGRIPRKLYASAASPGKARSLHPRRVIRLSSPDADVAVRTHYGSDR